MARTGQKRTQRELAHRGGASRIRDYKEVYRQTGDHKAAIRAYCAGNRWLEENARAVGNW